MGGPGSGRPRRKIAVERCLTLSAGGLQSDKLLREGQRRQGTLTWRRVFTGQVASTVGYEVNTLDPADPWIRLHYSRTWGEAEADFRVRLTTTPLPWGGVRWWFICPLTVNGRSCWRRCGKLYLPPGGRYFGCRLCYDLTYKSAQEAHCYDGLYAMLAERLGTCPGAIKWVLRHG